VALPSKVMAVAAGHGQVEAELVSYGRPATEALAARIAAAQAAHPLDTVTVIVPSNPAGLSARRLLGSGALGATGLANVGFVTPFRLAELLGSTELGERRPLTNPVLAAAARRVLADEPGIFAEVAGHQATQAALVHLYGELSRALPATLAAIAASSDRGAEVVRLVDAVRTRLADHHDEDDLAVAAAQRLARDPAAAQSLGTVVWHLPDRLSPAMGDLVCQVLAAAPSSVVVGLTGVDDADAPVRDVCASAGVELPAASPVAEPHAERIVSVSDPDEEVRTVIREVMALAEAGTDLDRIAVFLPIPEPYARTVLEQLDAAGIPHNGPATARLADSVAGRTLLGALALPGLGWGRADVISLLAGAPVRHDGHRAPSGRWDTLSRGAGAVGGLDDWRAKLAAHAARLTADRARLEERGDASEARLRRLAEDVDELGRLGAFVDGLAADLDGLASETSWAARSAAARSLLERLLGAEHQRAGWPDHEVDAAQRVDAALARLVVLDEIEPEPTATAFEQAVQAELDARTGRVGRFGHGVLVAPLAASVGLDLEAVFVLGMVEGTCPSFRRDDTLLPDADRELATGGELLTRQQRLADQHRAYLAALAAGGGHRTLLLPRGDLRDRRSRLASRWLLDSLGHQLGRKVFSSDVADLGPDDLEKVASYADGVRRAAVQGTVTDRDVAALLTHVRADGDPIAHPLATGPLGRGILCARSRQGAAFTEWDGNLSSQALPSPAAGHPISSSRLETWAKCPFRYFMAHVLRLDDRDDPEEITEIGALDLGSLVHEVLERFIGEVIARPGGSPAPHERWTEADRARIGEVAEEVFDRYEVAGLTGRPLLWRRTKGKVLDDLQKLLDRDDAHRASEGARPVSVEMPFGIKGEPPLTLELADGRTLAFRGYADRVDEAEDGRLVVLDYKTGRNSYAKLDDDPVLAGTTLQLGIYAEAAKARLGGEEVDARYWMASTRGEFRQWGYLWTEDRRERFLDVIGTIVDGIESGTFPGRPGEFDSYWGTHENCGFCAFDKVCPRDRDDHAQAKAGAPELSLLDRLAAPAAEDDDQ
ncbi:MAG: PD-(D/E)XK nuclease family protein, partial [Acidimicrobiales bacterium]